MHSSTTRVATVVATMTLLVVIGASGIAAQGAYVATDRFGYAGTIERYNTLADLLAGTNAVTGSPFSVPGRDLGLYVVDGNAAFAGGATYANTAIFLSAWYYGSTPSNQNTGFIQMYDVEGGSVSSVNGQWLDLARTTYGFTLTGGNTLYGCDVMAPDYEDCGRLWNAGSPLGSAATTAGIFHSYALNFTVSGLSSAVWNPATGVYESLSFPTAVAGNLTGIFHNTNTADPGSNGWYKYDLALNMNSWAYDNGYLDPAESAFGSAEVVPEPASMLLLVTGLVGVAGAAYRRREDEGGES